MRVCIRVFGIVQGVGFRPTVKRHADACDIAGSVSNKGPYVEIFAEGSEECVYSFIKQIQEEPPKRAVILKLDVEMWNRVRTVFIKLNLKQTPKKSSKS